MGKTYTGDSFVTSTGVDLGKSKADATNPIFKGGGKFESSVQVGDSTDNPTSDNVGAIRYREGKGASYVDMCMKVGGEEYAWMNILTNFYK